MNARSAAARPLRRLLVWLDERLGRGSYRPLRDRLDPEREYTAFAYARLVGQLVGPSTRWLDAGCGHQVFEVRLARDEREAVDRAGFVVGCDAYLPALRRHRTLRRTVGCLLTHLPFADRSLNLVTLNMVVEHLADPRAVFAELGRTVAPSGVVVVHTPNVKSYFMRLVSVGRRMLPDRAIASIVKYLEDREEDDILPTHYRANTRRSLKEQLGAAGFVEERCLLLKDRPLSYFFAPLSVLEMLVSKYLVLRGKAEWGAPTILAVYRRVGVAASPSWSAAPDAKRTHVP